MVKLTKQQKLKLKEFKNPEYVKLIRGKLIEGYEFKDAKDMAYEELKRKKVRWK